MNVILVLITFPTEESARQIGTVLIEKQLAACVNLLPQVTSLFRWQGKICEENEVMAIVKSTHQAYPHLEALVKSLHPYDCPELICITPTTGSTDYLQWVEGEC